MNQVSFKCRLIRLIRTYRIKNRTMTIHPTTSTSPPRTPQKVKPSVRTRPYGPARSPMDGPSRRLMSMGTASPVPPPVATETMTLWWNWWTEMNTSGSRTDPLSRSDLTRVVRTRGWALPSPRGGRFIRSGVVFLEEVHVRSLGGGDGRPGRVP